MKDRTSKGLTTSEAKFEKNECGWEAVDYKVIVRKDKVEETTAGGIVLPGDVKEQEWWNVFTGVLVSKGHLAFTEGRNRAGEVVRWEREPQIGQRVMLREHAGIRFEGDDGEEYAMYNDKDIGAIK